MAYQGADMRERTSQDHADSESWLPISGWEGLYQISNLGRVCNVRTGRILKPQRVANTLTGHVRVTLQYAGHKQRISVHKLVLEAFIGPCPDGMQGCHENDVGSDNRLSNLRWDTPSRNAYDCIENGNHPSRRKTSCPQGHKYDTTNTYWYTTKHGHVQRQCRTCHRNRVAQIKLAARDARNMDADAQSRSAAARELANKRWNAA